MLDLSVFENYKKKNNFFLKNSSIIEQRTFNNTHNKINNINDDAQDIKEITKYSCTQHKLYDHTLKKIKGFTKKEFELFKLITLKVQKLTKILGQENNVKSSLINSIYQKRIYKQFFSKNLKILEIGGGSGYLSSLLCMSGYNVDLYDITESYYIYQIFLLNYLEINNELSEDNNSYLDGAEKINHIPWWIFRNIEKLNIKYDVIMINNAICEFNGFSLNFFLNHVCKVLNYPKLFFIGSGKEDLNKMNEIVKKLNSFNYYTDPEKTLINNNYEIYGFKHQLKKNNKNYFKKLFNNIFLERKNIKFENITIYSEDIEKFYQENNIIDNKELSFYKKLYK
tara:strand:+ start:102 stop:1118 length:1017 start_codon:yes stop_codon:yes gene_type:complete